MAVNGVSNYGKGLDDLTPIAQRTTTRDLGQQDFLKIMIEQLRGQNPLDGGGDANQFFAQMVQFQTLDAITGMQKAITQLAQVSDLANASAMVGKTVTAMSEQSADPETGFPRPDKSVTAKVVSVSFGNDGAMLNLEGNITVSASKVAVIK